MRKIYCSRKLFPCAKRSMYYTLKDFYQKLGIHDLDEIQSKANLTMRYLENETEVNTYRVGLRLLRGKKTPVAMISDPNENKPVFRNGRPYLRNVGDWVIMIVADKKAYLVIEHTNIYCPDKWSEEDKDFIFEPPTYTMLTDNRIKDVFDTLN